MDRRRVCQAQTQFQSELLSAVLPLLDQCNRHSELELHRYVSFTHSPLPLFVSKVLIFHLGTGVWVVGGRRSISGAYSVQVDNQPAQLFPANPQSDTQYQVVLGGVNGLPFGEHTVVVKNLSTDRRQSVLDIDLFRVETAAGTESGETFSGPTVVDDAGAGITYSRGGWATASRVAPSSTPFTGGTVHESDVNGATAEFSFEGRGVSVVGAVGPRNGNFSVELDGKDMGEMSAKAFSFHPLTPLVSW